MTDTPDTTEAVARYLYECDADGWPSWDQGHEATRDEYRELARTAIEADRKTLADAGYVVVPNDFFAPIQPPYMLPEKEIDD